MTIQIDPSKASDERLRTRLVVAAGLVWCKNRLLIQRRSSHSPHGSGSLEFPGGKIELGESPKDALARELVEELGPVAAGFKIGDLADVCHHTYECNNPEVILIFYHVYADDLAHDFKAEEWFGQFSCESGVRLYVVRPTELEREQFLLGDQEIVDALVSGTISRPQEWVQK